MRDEDKTKAQLLDELSVLRNRVIELEKNGARDFTDSIIRSMTDALIVTDHTGQIKTINRATEKILGYKEHELAGKWVSDIFAVAEEKEISLLIDKFNVKQMQDGATPEIEIKFGTKEKSIIPLMVKLSVIIDMDGNVAGIVLVARDIREIKRLMQKEKELAIAAAATEAEKKNADELRAVNQQLRASEQQQKATNQQLRAKEAELQSKMADLERFNKFMVGRELVMIELKKEVNALLEKSGQPIKYESLENIKT